MRAWILALVHTIWTFQGECWTERWNPTSADGLPPKAR
jgi:hypothetical protein